MRPSTRATNPGTTILNRYDMTILYGESRRSGSIPYLSYLLIYEESCSSMCGRMYGQFKNWIDISGLSSGRSTDPDLSAS